MLTVIIPQRRTTSLIPECKRPKEKLPKSIRRDIYKERAKIQKCDYSLQELRARERNAHNTYIYSATEKFGNTTYWLIMREAFGQEADMIEEKGTAVIDENNIYEKSKQQALRMCVEREMKQQCCLTGEE